MALVDWQQREQREQHQAAVASVLLSVHACACSEAGRLTFVSGHGALVAVGSMRRRKSQ
jgi:hypothetical protein